MILVLLFSSYLTRPLRRVVATMKDIISTNDLSKRVVVEYHDEIGQLAQTFNIMVNGLERGLPADQGVRAEGRGVADAGAQDQGGLPPVRAQEDVDQVRWRPTRAR